MATQIITELTDDIDQSKADRTVSFGLDGLSYEIDLSKKHAAALEKVLRPYIERGRRARPMSAAAGAKRARGKSRSDLPEIRVWARANGMAVSERGRISHEVVEAYDSAK